MIMMNLKSVPMSTKKLSQLPKIQGIKEYSHMVERLRRNLFYGNNIQNKHDDNEDDDDIDNIDYPSMPLTEVTVQMFHKAGPGNQGLDIFDMNFASTMSRKSSLTPCSIVLALIYLERLKKTNPEYLRSVSPCDLFLVSIMVASKFLFDNGEDEEVLNDEWASAGGIHVKELNKLEINFLSALDWSCYVDDNTFIEQLIKLEAKISLQEFTKRGKTQITYNELMAIFDFTFLLPNNNFWAIIMERFFQVLVLSYIAYLVAAFTLIASTSLIIPSTLNMIEKYNSLITFSQFNQLKIINDQLNINDSNGLNNDIDLSDIDLNDIDLNEDEDESESELNLNEEEPNDEEINYKNILLNRYIEPLCQISNLKIQIDDLITVRNNFIPRLSAR